MITVHRHQAFSYLMFKFSILLKIGHLWKLNISRYFVAQVLHTCCTIGFGVSVSTAAVDRFEPLNNTLNLTTAAVETLTPKPIELNVFKCLCNKISTNLKLPRMSNIQQHLKINKRKVDLIFSYSNHCFHLSNSSV